MESSLGDSSCQRHLAALKAGSYTAAGTGVLSFVAFARRFTIAGSVTSALTEDVLIRTRRRRKLVQLHDTRTSLFYASVTSTR